MNLNKLKNILNLKFVIVGLDRGKDQQSSDFQHSYIKMQDVSIDGKILLSDLIKVEANLSECLKYDLVIGDIVLNTRNSLELVGKSGIVHIKRSGFLLFNNNLLRLRTKNEVDPFYLNYYMLSERWISQLNKIKSGTTNVAAIYWNALRNLEVQYPKDKEDQKRIVDFLDKKISLIDKKISLLEKKIELYEEYKNKYLNEMISSGVPSRLKNDIRKKITDGPHETPDFLDEGVPFLSVDGIQGNKLIFEGCRRISKENHLIYSKKAKIERGDLLLGKAASVGKIAIVDTDFEFSIWSPLALIKPKRKLNSKFLYYIFQSSNIKKQISDLSTFNTQQNISMKELPRLTYFLPDIKKQEEIAFCLDNKFEKINKLIELTKKEIDLQKEYKKTLINDVVTGKLEV